MSSYSAAPHVGLKARRLQQDFLDREFSKELASLSLSAALDTPPALVTPPPLSVRPRPPQLQLQLQPLRPSEGPAVQDFLKRWFFVKEPLNVAARLLRGPGDRCKELEEFCISSLQDGLSFKAVMGGRWVGVLIGGLARKEDDPTSDYSDSCSHPVFRRILKFLYETERDAALFSRHPHLNVMCDMKIIAVDESCAGQGIASALFERLLSEARAQKLQLLKSVCTSHYSARMLHRRGCEVAHRVSYEDYYHSPEEDEPAFPCELPHQECQVLTLRL